MHAAIILSPQSCSSNGCGHVTGTYYESVVIKCNNPTLPRDETLCQFGSGLKYGLKVCCGAGGQGEYNYNNKARCGMAGSSACADPGNYLIWDGIHLTEAAYRSIADGWLKGPYCNPRIQH
jgi:hypothetical protein